MAVYAIGDVHGCFNELKKLLKRIRFNPDRDRLWFVGDLLNKGPDSLAVLRLVHGLRDNAIVLVGNHEARALELFSRANSTGGEANGKQAMGYLLNAPDADKLYEWMRSFPLLHIDEELGAAMVHAGLHPDWTFKEAGKRAARLSKVFSSVKKSRELFAGINENALQEEDLGDVKGDDLRFSLMVFTRMRLASADGRLIFPREARSMGLSPYGFPPEDSPVQPWFVSGAWLNQARTKKIKLFYGHWAALGLQFRHPTYGLDSGAVYGRALTALRIDHPHHGLVLHQVKSPMYQLPITNN